MSKFYHMGIAADIERLVGQIKASIVNAAPDAATDEDADSRIEAALFDLTQFLNANLAHNDELYDLLNGLGQALVAISPTPPIDDNPPPDFNN